MTVLICRAAAVFRIYAADNAHATEQAPNYEVLVRASTEICSQSPSFSARACVYVTPVCATIACID
jgi:hypothetical protein